MPRKTISPKPKRKKRAAAKPRPVTPLLQMASTWPFVSQKTMFGCNVLLAQGKLFLIEMEESLVLRVGLARLDGALRVRGAESWNPWNPEEPGDWVSFPVPRRTISSAFADLARAAYDHALTKKPSPKKKTRRTKGPGGRRRRVGRPDQI